MSNKRYRTMPKPDSARPMMAAPQPAPAPQAPAMSAEDSALLESVKRFLGKVLEKTSHALDQLDSTPIDESEYNPRRMEWRNSQIAILVRMGIAATRVLIQAFKLSGAGKQATAMLKETVSSLETRLQAQTPQLAAD